MPKDAEIFFSADAAIIARLGLELVARLETALAELVKNSYDADATEVYVEFSRTGAHSSIVIRDNGSGMTRSELVKGFLRLASDAKVNAPTSPGYGRQRAGKKGIGRFATQRLGERLLLQTRRADARQGIELEIDWSRFKRGRQLTAVPVKLRAKSGVAVGTRLEITGLRDSWTDAQIKRCWRGLLALQQPFPLAPVRRAKGKDPGFKVEFVGVTKDGLVRHALANMQTEVLQHSHAEIELVVSKSGRAKWRLAANKFGSTTDWVGIAPADVDVESSFAARFENISSVRMRAYYFIQKNGLLPPLLAARIKEVLNEEGGIRLYRNGFRVIPYGERGDDWLGLDETYRRRSVLVPATNQNFFGIVEIDDPTGERFEEHTSREGLIENAAFSELKDLLSSVLLTAATRIGEQRGKKTRAGGKGQPQAPVEATLSDVSSALSDLERAVASTPPGRPIDPTAVTGGVQRTRMLLEAHKGQVARLAQELADETAMLRMLATLGMVSAEFNHEAGMAFDAFRSDMTRVISFVMDESKPQDRIRRHAERARRLAARLDGLTGYLTSLASARAVRELSIQSLSRTISDFGDAMKAQARSQNVELEVLFPPFDPLFVKPTHSAELASVLLNLYTNAVKAIKRRDDARRIRIVGSRDGGEVVLRFSDTGDGIPVDVQDRIFSPFFTTAMSPGRSTSDGEHASGSGLGLWIVDQIVRTSGGQVSLVDPEQGYSTTFEVRLPAQPGME